MDTGKHVFGQKIRSIEGESDADFVVPAILLIDTLEELLTIHANAH